MGGDREEAGPSLALRGIEVVYPGFRLGPIRLTLGKGLHAVLGPNGAGKTTLLRSIVGLVPRRGEALLGNVVLGKWNAWRLVSSNLAEPPRGFHARVLDYARLYLEPLYGESWAESVAEVFEELGVEWMLERSWDSLSDGQRSIALTLVAVAKRTPLLLLDEPFSHLDPYWTCRVLSLLRREAASRVIVYTTHDFLTPSAADTVTLVRQGEVVAHGSPGEVIREDKLRDAYGVPFSVIRGLAIPSCPEGPVIGGLYTEHMQ